MTRITNKDIIREIQSLQDISKDSVDFDPQKEESKTRGMIAKFFIKRFIYILVGAIVLVILYNSILLYMVNKEILELTDVSVFLLQLDTTIPIITSALGTPLGFVVGYYFKTSESNGS